MAGFDRSILYATGAYGREATIADWLAGKDFKLVGGPYFSIRDAAMLERDGTAMLAFQTVGEGRGYIRFYVMTSNPTGCVTP